MIWLPNVEQVLEMHSILIRRTGGLEGIRDRGADRERAGAGIRRIR